MDACERFREMAWAQAGELDEGEQAALAAHQATCAGCRAEADGVGNLRDALAPAAAALDGPEAVAEARETRAEVLAAIGELEPRYRAAMVLRELVGLPIDEIAQALEVPVGTVKTLLFRGRERLRRRLSGLAAEVA